MLRNLFDKFPQAPDAQDIWEPLWSNLIKSPPSRVFLFSGVCTPQSAAEGLNFNNLNVVSNYNLRVGFQITAAAVVSIEMFESMEQVKSISWYLGEIFTE